MTAGTYDFTIEQGTDLLISMTLKDSADVALDLTGYTGRMQIRPFKTSSTILWDSSTLNSINITPSSGILTINLLSSVTEDFTFVNGVYDLELTVSNLVSRLLEGKVTVSKEVTRGV